MPLDIYTPMQLYRIMYDDRIKVSTSHWRSMFFGDRFFSAQEEIMFDKIRPTREIAPFMLPNMPGKPIYRREGEQIQTFKPAYTKPKDAVRPSDVIQMGPGELARRVQLQTPEARYSSEVQRILTFQRNAVERLWDYMAAKSLIDGAIDIKYDTDAGTPNTNVTIDFGRDGAHTIVKTVGNYWGDAGVDVFDDLQRWIDIVAVAEFGGSVGDVIMGALAASAFLQDQSIKDKLDTNFRGSGDVYANRGLIVTDPLKPFTLIGQLASGVNVWRYVDVAPANDALKNVLGQKEVLLVAPNVDGVQAFGAILDEDADLQATDIFSKMWKQEDPSARFIMTQSAPLMIPVNPNCTLKATVLA